MAEPKPIASLSGILLARKGLARPAMRRPSMLSSNGNGVISQDDLGWNDMGYDVDSDPTTPMDYDHGFPGADPLAAGVPGVKHLQDRLANALSTDIEPEAAFDSFADAPESVTNAQIIVSMTPEPLTRPVSHMGATDAPRSRARAKPGLKEKSAFTLRLDGERHLKLRLACVVRQKSGQQLVSDALDALIESMPEIGQLAVHILTKKH